MGRMEVSAEEPEVGAPLALVGAAKGMGVERTEGSFDEGREVRFAGLRSRPARRSSASSSGKPSPVAGCLPLRLAEGVAMEGVESRWSMEKRSSSSLSLSSFCFSSSAAVMSSRCSTLRRDSWSSVWRI